MCSYSIVTNRKLSHERGQDPPPLPAGPFCGGGGPALEATRFGVLVGSVPVDGAQAAPIGGQLWTWRGKALCRKGEAACFSRR